MSKPVHPIKKLAERLVFAWPDYSNHQIRFAEKEIARHVEPLLNALEQSHAAVAESPRHPKACDWCKLLAAWRAKPEPKG